MYSDYCAVYCDYYVVRVALLYIDVLSRAHPCLGSVYKTVLTLHSGYCTVYSEYYIVRVSLLYIGVLSRAHPRLGSV